MKTRSNFLSKATIFMLLAALTLVISFPVAAVPNSTTLTSTIPESFPLMLELSGNGKVAINGVAYTQSGTIEIPRNSAVELRITPDTENEIKSVFYNGYDYMKEVKGGRLTLPAITGEATLCVNFTEIASTPQTGDAYSPLCVTLLMTFSLIGMIATLSFRKKKVN